MSSHKTLSYYNDNARTFAERTLNVDFSVIQNRFLDQLPDGAFILDFGCGIGRDTRYFADRGYQVEAVDGSEELCRLAREHTGMEVKCMLFQELQAENKYDAVWACSSILHLPYDELISVLNKVARSLKEEGLLYTCFKYGTEDGIRNGRYFTDLTEEKLSELLCEIPQLQMEEQWITSDVRPERDEEKWLNVFLRKKRSEISI